MSRFELRTKRLLLRDFVPADFDSFYATSAGPEYRRFCPAEETTRDSWREGLAYEPSRRLMEFAFSHLSVHRIYAETNAENARARALAQRLGMRLEGVLRQTRFYRGRWWDTAVYLRSGRCDLGCRSHLAAICDL